MSGFDFDALRDPEAPIPGARERAGVDARARSLRSRSRRNRLALSSVTVVAAVAVAFGVVATQRDNEPRVIVEGGTTSTTLPTTTTIHKPVSSSPAFAVSASFVSPDQGWVLEQDGTLVETSDGGATWSPVSHDAALRFTTNRIRFGDPSHGFAFEPRLGTALFATTDGGAHWTKLDTPFSSVSDLAIANDTVYVVGFPKDAPRGALNSFHIWSTPLGTYHWKADPVDIPVGAGPIPDQQLAFAGGRGWMVNNDRDLISAARITSAGGAWTTWKLPCVGSASIAASTVRDLVLACGPAFATSEQTSTIYFSHDGGATFARVSQPNAPFGAQPFSGSSDTAVTTGIAASSGSALWRTTDGGASWRQVASVQSGDGAPDYGFTTSMQGFYISNGTMLMTYDAGATWQKVTLP